MAIAISLLISPLFGMLYLGRVARALAYLGVVLVLGYTWSALPVLSQFGSWLPLIVFNVLGAIDAQRIAVRDRSSAPIRWYSRWYGLAGLWVVLIGIVAVIRVYAIEFDRVTSASMLPTIEPQSLVWVDKFSYTLGRRSPQRGDVVLVVAPDGRRAVYRVVGLPGERFAYRDHVIYIGGNAVERENRGPFTFKAAFGEDSWIRYDERVGDLAYSVIEMSGVQSLDFELTIPQGRYFVLGDNRDRAADSRFMGPVAREQVLGRVLAPR